VTQVSVKQAADGLRNLGMGDVQIQALSRDRTVTDKIEIRSPATGFVVERNVSPGLRFERGKQLYRIADLNRIWILADLFENEGRLIRPGQIARVNYQGRTWQARMADVLPQVDPAARTLKVRFELENSGYALRPDMFVDVEFDVHLPPTIAVSADAVIDSGLRKTVFVDAGDGYFEPRTVETGWRTGDRVQITKGLEAGDRIVVSGNFLLDSEGRMKLTSLRTAAASGGKDPACGMEVDPAKAAAKSEHKGRTYYFCSQDCKDKFDKNPEQYLGKQQVAQRAGAPHD